MTPGCARFLVWVLYVSFAAFVRAQLIQPMFCMPHITFLWNGNSLLLGRRSHFARQHDSMECNFYFLSYGFENMAPPLLARPLLVASSSLTTWRTKISLPHPMYFSGTTHLPLQKVAYQKEPELVYSTMPLVLPLFFGCSFSFGPTTFVLVRTGLILTPQPIMRPEQSLWGPKHLLRPLELFTSSLCESPFGWAWLELNRIIVVVIAFVRAAFAHQRPWCKRDCWSKVRRAGIFNRISASKIN